MKLVTRLTVVAMVVSLAGCAAEEEPAGTTEAPPSTQAAATVTVTGVDYGYRGLPESVEVGTTLVFENESTNEVHELVAIRLPDDETRPVSELVQLPPEELAAFFPGVETVLIAPPGSDGFAVEGTGELTEPGRYAIVCVIPTGADPDEYLTAAAESEGGPPEVAGGPPHIVNGMFAELTVTG